jgi:hypothetical protein
MAQHTRKPDPFSQDRIRQKGYSSIPRAWREQEAARRDDVKAALSRANELAWRLKDMYGLDITPARDLGNISQKEKRSLDAKYKRERQPGFRDSVRNYGVFYSAPKSRKRW